MIRTQSEARRLARTQAHVVKSLLIWSWVVDSGKLKGHGPDDGPSHEKTGAGGGDGGDGGGDGATQPLQLLWPALKPASRSSVALRAATICAVQPLHSSRWQFQSPLHQSSHGGGALGGGGNTSRGGLGGFGGEGSAGGCAGGVGGCAGGGDGERQPCQSPAVSLLTEAGVHSAHRESAQ